jgi:hypothetical protein
MNNLQLSALDHIKSWHEKTNPVASDDSVHRSISNHLEKTSNMLFAFRDVGRDFNTREQIGLSADVISHLQRQIRAGRNGTELVVDDIDTCNLAHNLCAQIISIVGVAHSLRIDIVGALAVTAASYDKKYDNEGEPIFNDLNIPVSGPNYGSPDLTPYI